MIPLDRFDELAGGLHHPEGVAWNPVDGRVYAGGEGGELYAVTLEGEVEQVGSSGGSMLGIAVDGLAACTRCDAGKGEIARWDPSTGEVVDVRAGRRRRRHGHAQRRRLRPGRLPVRDVLGGRRPSRDPAGFARRASASSGGPMPCPDTRTGRS